VSSDELDPKLEAATRLYIYGREQNLRRLFLPTARRWLSGWRRRWEEVAAATEASERDSSLIDEILHDKTLQRLDEKTQRELDNTVRELIVLRGKSDEEIARFARKPQELECEKQDTLNSMVQKLYDSQKPVKQRFRPFAQLLADEEVRRRVSRRVTNELLPIMDELFVLFETPERSETWTLEFERRLLSELQRIADKETIKTASSGKPTTDQNAVDQRTQQIGDRVVSHLPPRSEPPAPAPEPPASKILGPPGDEVPERAVAQESGADAPLSKALSKRLQRGKDCEAMVLEIRKIKSDVREHGMTIFQSREAHPEFRIWNLVDHLPDEDKKTFNKPDEWGPVRGYANRLLARHYGVEPSVVDDSRKEWRAHEKSAIPKTSS
jgi:hypothetical protein